MADLLGSTPGIIVGVGVGAAASAALEPAIEIPRQEAWKANPNRILDPSLMARLVAQGAVELQLGRDSARREGFDADKFDHLVYLAQSAASIAQALDMWRKFDGFDDLWTHALVKAGLDARYLPFFNRLRYAEVVGLGDIGYGVVRGILPAPPWVPVAPPTSGDKVPRFPQVQLDPLDLAHKLGYDEDMLKLIVGRSGLSMAPNMAARAFFREIIGPNDYLLAIAEGDLRTEWAESVLEVSREILTAGQYVERQIRGFTDRAGRLKDTRKHGMSDEDSDKLYDVLGRAPGVHAITTGLARGGKFPGSYANVPEPYKSALQRSNIREEYAELEYHDRYSYPSAFVLRSLAQEGDLGDTAAVEQILLEIGWKPDLAAKVAAKWTTTMAKADPWVGKADTQLWTATHKAYKGNGITAQQAQQAFDLIGIDAAAQTEVLARWDLERQL